MHDGRNDSTRWTLRRAVRATCALAALMLGLLTIPAATLAGTRCVPNKVDGRCPPGKIYPTIQAAIDAAARNDIIVLGPGTLVERVVVTKNLRFQCVDGAVLTDEGLPPGDALVTYQDTSTAHQYWRGCAMEVATSDVGVKIPSSLRSIKLQDVTLTRIGDRAGIGILIDGSDGKPNANDMALDDVVIQNFDIGARVIDARGLNFEPAIFIGNRVGAHVTNGAGQFFYNSFIDNEIGLIWEGGGPGSPRFNTLDNNGNTFINNDIALWLGPRLNNAEFHWNDITYGPGQIAFRVETAPGIFLEGDTAYRAGSACGNVGFGPIDVNGVRYDKAPFMLRQELCK